MDDMAIFNKVLSVSELQSVMNFSDATPPPPDTTPPTISAVAAGSITSSGAIITWTTDEASNTQIEYGITTAYGSTTTLDPTLVTNHSQTLSSLTSQTLYHYRVLSKDAAGNLQISNDFTFTTADVTPPTISAVTSSNVTGTGATISWTTNELSTSQVNYGTTTAYGSTTPLDPTLVTAHSINLSGLAAGTTYHFQVVSKDAAGNLALSVDMTFTTPTVAPVITNISAKTVNGIPTITYTTNKLVTTTVMGGMSPNPTQTISQTTSPSTGGSFALTGWTSTGSWYYFTISMTDSSGNTTITKYKIKKKGNGFNIVKL